MVTDINDKNPEFVGLPYEFSVKEGEARKLIGRVHAEDADEGVNAEITYFAPDDIPFTVDPETGDVLTKIVLDYEQNDVSDPRQIINVRRKGTSERIQRSASLLSCICV